MALCPNCGAQLTCSCQQRTASDGKATCQNCVGFYEQDLVRARQLQQQQQQQQQQINNNITDILLNS